MLVRDWRAGELRVLAAALVIAVASVTSVAFFADRVGQALARDAHQLLGADLVLVADQPWQRRGRGRDRAAAAWSSAAAINFMSMAIGQRQNHARRRQGGDARTIRCAAGCASRRRPARPTRPRERGPARGTVWIEERLVTALGAPVGSRLALGRAEFEVAAVLTLEPERSANFFNIAPRLMMNVADVPATGLIQTGSRVSYYLYAAGPRRTRCKRSKTALQAAPGARPAHRQPGDRPARSARVDRARAALPRPDRAARRDPRRRRRRARHAALRRAPPRRLRGDALPRRDAGAAAARSTAWSSLLLGVGRLRRGLRAGLRRAGGDRRRARRACCAPSCRRRRCCRRCRASSSAWCCCSASRCRRWCS